MIIRASVGHEAPEERATKRPAEVGRSVVAVFIALLMIVVQTAYAGGSDLVDRFLRSESFAQSPVIREIPLVPCATTGQVDDDAPRLPVTIRMPVVGGGSNDIAFYSASADGGSGVLAPRGWTCIRIAGSAGARLIVAPREAARTPQQLSPATWAGPMIVRTIQLGDTSGRFAVAHLSARLFPRALSFVNRVRAEGLDTSEYVFRPWPHDRLEYLSEALVKYETSGSAGLGYLSGMKPGVGPIRGIAGLLGDFGTPDSLHLAVRLDDGSAFLYPMIAAQMISSSSFAGSPAARHGFVGHQFGAPLT